MPGILDQISVLPDQTKIHAPGVDPDAVQMNSSFASRNRQAVSNLLPQPQRVPVKS